VSDSTSKPSGPFCQKCHRDMSGDTSLYLYGGLYMCSLCHAYATFDNPAPSDLDRLQERLEIAEGIVRDVSPLGVDSPTEALSTVIARARAYVAEHPS
jgi:hypothetical protein